MAKRIIIPQYKEDEDIKQSEDVEKIEKTDNKTDEVVSIIEETNNSSSVKEIKLSKKEVQSKLKSSYNQVEELTFKHLCEIVENKNKDATKVERSIKFDTTTIQQIKQLSNLSTTKMTMDDIITQSLKFIIEKYYRSFINSEEFKNSILI